MRGFIAAVAWMFIASSAWGQACRVLDPQLQGSYTGPCVNGFAEGTGRATGVAIYEGQFKAGRKHGRGVKIWANGDRYEGDFADDRKQGQGTYIWGRGQWEGERYEGSYVADRREGFGVYHSRGGDVYQGRWKGDAYAAMPTEPAALGAKVCKEVEIGGGQRDSMRGVVEARQQEFVGVRVEDPGAVKEARAGEHRWEPASHWRPCSEPRE